MDSFISTLLLQEYFVFYSIVLKIATIYGVPGNLHILCLLIPNKNSKRQQVYGPALLLKKKMHFTEESLYHRADKQHGQNFILLLTIVLGYHQQISSNFEMAISFPTFLN